MGHGRFASRTDSRLPCHRRLCHRQQRFVHGVGEETRREPDEQQRAGDERTGCHPWPCGGYAGGAQRCQCAERGASARHIIAHRRQRPAHHRRRRDGRPLAALQRLSHRHREFHHPERCLRDFSVWVARRGWCHRGDHPARKGRTDARELQRLVRPFVGLQTTQDDVGRAIPTVWFVKQQDTRPGACHRLPENHSAHGLHAAASPGFLWRHRAVELPRVVGLCAE